MTLRVIAIHELPTGEQIMTGTMDVRMSDHDSLTMTTGTVLVIATADEMRGMSLLVNNNQPLQYPGKGALVRSASGWRLLRP